MSLPYLWNYPFTSGNNDRYWSLRYLWRFQNRSFKSRLGTI